MPGPIAGLRFAHAAICKEVQELEHDALAIDEAASAQAFQARLDFFATFMKEHNDAEEIALFSALEEKAPGASEGYVHDHREDQATFAELHTLAKQVAAGERGTVLARLRRQMIALSAHTLTHVEKENELVIPRLESALTPPEQGAAFGKMMAHLAPSMPKTFGWMVRQLSPELRVQFLGALQKGQPPERFAPMAGLARAALPSPDWSALVAALPGLPS